MTNSMNKPELETLSYHNPLCKCPECEKKAEPKPEQPKNCNCVESRHLPGAIACPDCAEPEQSNQQLMLIQTIQGLTACILNSITKLPESELKAKALEEIDLFKKTTLYELQKEYE